MGKRIYFVANDNGVVACHDCDLGTATACKEEMERLHPGEGWEVMSEEAENAEI